MTCSGFIGRAGWVLTALLVVHHVQMNASVTIAGKLTDQLKQLEKELDTTGTGALGPVTYNKLRTAIQKRMRDNVTTYVLSQLQTTNVDPARLELQLTRSIQQL